MDERTERRFRDIEGLCDWVEADVDLIRRETDYARRLLEEEPARAPRP